MDSVKESCIVLMLNPNMLADGLRTSLGQLTFPILHPHVTGGLCGGKRENCTGNSIRL